MLEKARRLAITDELVKDIDELEALLAALDKSGFAEHIMLDFSIISDLDYYNGIVFRGYIPSVKHQYVLSGGRYDKLLEKMGKRCGAIGFAVYLDSIERFGNSDDAYDTDVLLVYEDVDTETIIDAVKKLVDGGKTVKVSANADGSVRYRQLCRISKRGVEILETND